MRIAVIGGGAAGFFAAIEAKRTNPENEVVILEKSAKFLSKVKISGGGRCNVTNATFDNDTLSKHYPRGERQLKRAFYQFDAKSTVEWFESRGVKLKTYPDNCIFPLANTSQAIIDCFLNEVHKLQIELKLQSGVKEIKNTGSGFELLINSETHSFDRIVITTGGQPKESQLQWLVDLGLKIVPPVPSLFTFNMPNNPITKLMGNVVEDTLVKIEGTKLIGRGPLLVTHWGMSGPAILQLSAWGARILNEKNYQFACLVNWLGETNETELRANLQRTIKEFGKKKVSNLNPFPITNKLWHFLMQKTEISDEIRWEQVQGKTLNKLVVTLLTDRYEVSGKTTFKEEFVTAGGIALSEIDFNTMESKKIPGLFFAGELLDIDGITGGFNFQAAWTTGFIAGRNVSLLS